MLPLRDVDGKHWSHQTLQKNGFKSILKDSRLQGTFGIIGAESLDKIKGDILIAEGYSTAASIHEATYQPVVISVTSNNLANVAKAIKEKYPQLELNYLRPLDINLLDELKELIEIIKEPII